MLLNKIVLSKTPPTSPNTVWAKPSNGGVSLYTYSDNKWGPILLMDDMGTDNPDDDLPGKVITLELFDETIQDLKDYVSENYVSNIKVLITTPPATLNAQVGYYYCMGGSGVVVDTMTIQLPAIADYEESKTKNVQFFMTMGSAPEVTFVSAGTERILYQKDFALEAKRSYEVNALWNGHAWVITAVEIIVPFFAKLSLNNGEVIELQGSGELTYEMVSPYQSSLVSAEIGKLCTSIGYEAFSQCTGLTSVTIGSGVTYIGESPFEGCTSLPVVDNIRYADTYAVEAVDKTLTTYTIKEGTKWIGSDAFGDCTSLTSITIPDSVTSIGNSAFSNCSDLTSVTIGNGVTSIGNNAFSSCSRLTSITIGSSVTSIGNGAFSGCSGLTSIIIPDSVTSIGGSAFSGCSGLTNITIPDSVTSIGSGAFYNCRGLTDVTIGSGVTNIGNNTFQGCTNLTSVTIGSGVTTIDNYAFMSCTGLTSITSLATTAPKIQSATFKNIKNGGTLTVPVGSTGYDVWMGTGDNYLGKYGWTKVEQ